jgi:uncharacterized membrane protein
VNAQRPRRSLSRSLSRSPRALLSAVILVGSIFGGLRVLGSVRRNVTQEAQSESLLRRQSDIVRVVNWKADDPLVTHAVEPKTRDLLTEVYALSWAILDDGANGGKVTERMTQTLSGAALTQAERALLTSQTRGQSRPVVHVHHVKHVLRVTYYSEDKSIIAIDAESIVRERTIEADTSQHGFSTTSTTHQTTNDRFKFVMRLQDGDWRLENIDRGGSND